MRLTALILPLLILSAPGATAQGSDGEDTAGAWRNTHASNFGGWDSVCDENGDQVRCYLRYVDVYRPRPNFGALFAFVQTGNGSETVEIGLEFGTNFAPEALTVTGSKPDWMLEAGLCTGAVPCALTGDAARAMLDAMGAGGTLMLTFTDQYGDPQSRTWDLGAFAAARDDLATQAAARGL